MKEFTLKDTVKEKDENLTLRFAIAAFLAVILSACLMTSASYYYLRSIGLNTHLQAVAYNLLLDLNELEIEPSDISLDPLNSIKMSGLQRRHKVMEIAFFDSETRLLWSNSAGQNLQTAERTQFESAIVNRDTESSVIDPFRFSIAQIKKILSDAAEPMVVMTPLIDADRNFDGMIKTQHDFSGVLKQARRTSEKLFAFILLGHLILVLVLYLNFRRGIQTIEKQESKLSQQISRLSNLLSLNKSMQKSMKSASSRAVELNEQFLRRVGSDLHDGPAQSIGYAVLRLEQIGKQQESKQLGHEFHVVKEALDGALKEIREISTGLVLPELDELTLEQSLNRVVSRHQANGKTKVSQFYQDLPNMISTPVKICAYRFVQEGLNNASRHGQAEKCRVSAYVKADVLHLSLKDNGMGFRKSQLSTEGGHLGLMGLKDRIESLGGKFSINSELGVGTAIKVSIALTDDV